MAALLILAGFALFVAIVVWAVGRLEASQRRQARTNTALALGGHVSDKEIVASVRGWTLICWTGYVSSREHDYVVTVICAPYRRRDDFEFEVRRRGFLGKLVRGRGKTGDADFNRDFALRGNDEGRLRELFAESELREAILRGPKLSLHGGAARAHGGDGELGELWVEGDLLRDPAQLAMAKELFGRVLDRLELIGSAEKPRPPAGPAAAAGPWTDTRVL